MNFILDSNQYVWPVSFGFRRRMAIYAQRNSILPLIHATSREHWSNLGAMKIYLRMFRYIILVSKQDFIA